ncbi:MAG: allantoinase AllB [Gluconacetobacter diazotrophicus]|nr:allantoinase AllB [Gluconacetobacter diazotrophicus]
MPDFDLLIRGAANLPAIGIAKGRVAALAEGSAREVVDAGGWLALPGAIDAHVHFNEPGRADWEGIETGSRACAVGGTTTFFDMPLNSTPPVCDAASFAAKRALAEQKSHVDFALWGGLVPGRLDAVEALHACGAVGLKAFMSGSGIDDFPKADAATLKVGMKRAAALGMVVAVHAEIDHPEYARGTTVRDYLASRPVSMELEAIRLALGLAGETGCALHVVHVSSADGIRLIHEAARAGVNVTCETCPHYLVLTDEDAARLGAPAKCAPPLRPDAERRALLAEVRGGRVDTVGSDHSPAPPSMKTDPDFFKVWGGVSGCQHLLGLLFDLKLAPDLVAGLTARAPSDRFGLTPGKGRIAVGADADVVLFDPVGQTPVTADSLLYRHKVTPYLGRTLRGAVRRTILRGRTVAIDGQPVGEPGGRLVVPAR